MLCYIVCYRDIFIFKFSGVPSSPTGPLEIVDVQRTSITIKWKPPQDDGGSSIIAYIVEKKHPESILWNRVDRVTANTLQHCCIKLYEKTEYLFRVIAINSVGESKPLESEGATLARSPFGKS